MGYPFSRSDVEKLANLRRLRDALTAFSEAPVGTTLKQHFDGAPDEFFATFGNVVDGISSCLGRHDESFTAFSTLAALNPVWSNAGSIGAVRSRAANALEAESRFDEWSDFMRHRGYFRQRGYGDLLQQIEDRTIAFDDAESAFELTNYSALAREIFRDSKELAGLTGEQLLTIQSQFRECDKRLSRLQRGRIGALTSKRQPPAGAAGGRVADYTELALIKHEIGKKVRHLPIRQLLKRAGGSVLALKPCFMMSPMSVAQYLEPGATKFDLVVMDEASQIRPEDALGAVARGGQLVVVGTQNNCRQHHFLIEYWTATMTTRKASQSSTLEASWTRPSQFSGVEGFVGTTDHNMRASFAFQMSSSTPTTSWCSLHQMHLRLSTA